VAGRSYADARNVQITQHPDGSTGISAELRGRPVPRWLSPLKAATYHDLMLERTDRGWRAVVLFDV
jgi:SHS2 domain-containing protein